MANFKDIRNYLFTEVPRAADFVRVCTVGIKRQNFILILKTLNKKMRIFYIALFVVRQYKCRVAYM
jgi:hypothetical protein